MNENKVIVGTGLLGRFRGGAVSLLHVYKKDGDDLNFYESILDDVLQRRNLNTLPDNWISKSNPREMNFNSECGIDINFGANASSPGGSAGIDIGFSKSKTAFIQLKSAIVCELALGELRQDILDVWDEKGYEKQPRKFVLVNKLIRAASGTVIYSMKKGNKIGLKAATPDVPLADIEPVTNGKIAIASSKSECLEVISEDPFEPLFGAVRVNRKDRFKAID